jgi:hypothetical protein
VTGMCIMSEAEGIHQLDSDTEVGSVLQISYNLNFMTLSSMYDITDAVCNAL